MLRFLLLVSAMAPSLAVGGYSPMTEIGPESRAHKLAKFGWTHLMTNICPSSNAFSCSRAQGSTIHHIVSASSQVVSGNNYRIVAETSAGHSATLTFYEQVWTKTLILTGASLIASDGTELGDLAEAETPLDGAAFLDEISAPATSRLAGGYSPMTEIGPDSRVHKLAEFGWTHLMTKVCPTSNALSCSRAKDSTIHHIVSASSQVVSGTNYRIVAETSAGHSATLTFYEQVWTKTLILTGASLSTSDGTELGDLVDSETPLDGESWAASAP